jgi:multidrug efflux system membrane fusion protein
MVVGADNKATYRVIVLGPMVDGMRIVRSGLEKGEHIIVDGLQRVRPNDVVVPSEVASPAEATSAIEPTEKTASNIQQNLKHHKKTVI